jgi:hypothetical protein
MLKTGVITAAVFLVGCLVGGASSQFIAPPARAQTPPARWEYFCLLANNPETATERLNTSAAQGWELQTAHSTGARNQGILCLRRPLS